MLRRGLNQLSLLTLVAAAVCAGNNAVMAQDAAKFPSGKNITISREEVDKRMTSGRIKVTAGPHEVGFTFIDRPAQEQNMWQPVLRDSLEARSCAGRYAAARRPRAGNRAPGAGRWWRHWRQRR